MEGVTESDHSLWVNSIPCSSLNHLLNENQNVYVIKHVDSHLQADIQSCRAWLWWSALPHWGLLARGNFLKCIFALRHKIVSFQLSEVSDGSILSDWMSCAALRSTSSLAPDFRLQVWTQSCQLTCSYKQCSQRISHISYHNSKASSMIIGLPAGRHKLM